MERWLSHPRGGWIFTGMALCGLGVFVFSIAVLMSPHAPVLGERMAEMSCLQLAFTESRASDIVLSFSPEQRAAMTALLVPGDVTFAWGYGLVLAGLVGLLTRRLDGAWFRAGAIAAWLPLAASLLDCIEDVFLFVIVDRLTELPGAALAPLPLFASVAATLKYIALSVLTPLFVFAGTARALRNDRRIGALLVYVLTVVAAASMIMQPLQRMPACF